MGRPKGVESGMGCFLYFISFHLDSHPVIFNISAYGLSILLCIKLSRKPQDGSLFPAHFIT